MKTYLECIPCFARQAMQAARFSRADAETEERVLRETLRTIDKMPWNGSPMEMARTVHGIVRHEVNSADPYRDVKKKSNREALAWYASLADDEGRIEVSIDTAIRLAIAGNIIDYGANANVDMAVSINELLAKELAYSEKDDFLEKLRSAKTITWLADNAGEIVFDRLLMETINRTYGEKRFLFVTRKEPFINDALAEDAEEIGLTKMPGVELAGMHPIAPIAMTDPQDCKLWQRIRASDVIISKGQGNYEGFSGESDIYFLLVVKCPVIARDLESQTGTQMHVRDIVLWRS